MSHSKDLFICRVEEVTLLKRWTPPAGWQCTICGQEVRPGRDAFYADDNEVCHATCRAVKAEQPVLGGEPAE